MGLIVKNIGGARKGVEDMGVLGNPAKYTMVLGENEEASPWEPQHVQYGFEASAEHGDGFLPERVRADRAARFGRRGHSANDQDSARRAVATGDDHYGAVTRGHAWPNRAGPRRSSLRTWSKPIQTTRAMSPGPASSGPESVRVIVAGGPGAWVGLVLGVGRWVTKPVCLPPNWDALVRKYGTYQAELPALLRTVPDFDVVIVGGGYRPD